MPNHLYLSQYAEHPAMVLYHQPYGFITDSYWIVPGTIDPAYC